MLTATRYLRDMDSTCTACVTYGNASSCGVSNGNASHCVTLLLIGTTYDTVCSHIKSFESLDLWCIIHMIILVMNNWQIQALYGTIE